MENHLKTRLRMVLKDEALYDSVVGIIEEEESAQKEVRKRQQKDGIARAKEQGIRFGRPRLEDSPEFDQIMLAWERGQITAKVAAQKLGVSLKTYQNRVKERRGEKQCPSTES